ncbi:fibronectin type III domain-containing protein [Carnobacterium maltaromaticum]|uniref:fibronectin type III domain-containing protein n=1 Tax=Carnobacterium maltaromaticum TaxID=2751 RepID=UPI0039BE4CCA
MQQSLKISLAQFRITKFQKKRLHPNAPQNVTGILKGDGSISVSWDAVVGAKSYVTHYAEANQSDPHQAVFMGYSEQNSWTLSADDVPALVEGDKIYIYIQTFTEKGVGADDIAKAAYLNENKLGSAWSKAVILTK